MTVLFEGFYASLEDGPLKKSLSAIRSERWGDNGDTLAMTFLLVYSKQIDTTRYIFGLASPQAYEKPKPWDNLQEHNFVVEPENVVMVDEKLEDEVAESFSDAQQPSAVITKRY